MQPARQAGSVFPVSNIGELIEAYQDKHGASDRALALRVNVTPTLIGRWKRGDFVQLPEKARVVTSGQNMLADGTPVTVRTEAKEGEATPKADKPAPRAATSEAPKAADHSH